VLPPAPAPSFKHPYVTLFCVRFVPPEGGGGGGGGGSDNRRLCKENVIGRYVQSICLAVGKALLIKRAWKPTQQA
jgi:hypothetical protein